MERDLRDAANAASDLLAFAGCHILPLRRRLAHSGAARGGGAVLTLSRCGRATLVPPCEQASSGLRAEFHDTIVAFRIETMASREVSAANDGYFLARRFCCSRRNFRSTGEDGSRHRKFLNTHMPAPVGSAAILTAFRSRNRSNAPLSDKARRSSASEMPLRFAVAAPSPYRMMEGWHF